MSDVLRIGLPSKGRLSAPAHELFAKRGLALDFGGAARSYLASIPTLPAARVFLLQAAEIAERLHAGELDVGLTGEDLVREETGALGDADGVGPLKALGLGFGRARVVVAVPSAWFDAATMNDLAEIAHDFRLSHGRRLRVATKYQRLTRSFFAARGVVDYRIVMSSGATEAAPASGLADAIVDITSSGATLTANHLKVVSDGEILASEASLFVARREWPEGTRAALDTLLKRLGAARL